MGMLPFIHPLQWSLAEYDRLREVAEPYRVRKKHLGKSDNRGWHVSWMLLASEKQIWLCPLCQGQAAALPDAGLCFGLGSDLIYCKQWAGGIPLLCMKTEGVEAFAHQGESTAEWREAACRIKVSRGEDEQEKCLEMGWCCNGSCQH